MTMTRRLTALSAILIGGLLLSATPAAAGDIAGSSSPVGEWRTRTDGIRQTITFTDDGQVFGDSGCNRFTGGYSVKGDRITIGPLASTLMACPERRMNAEASFLTRLQAAVSFTSTARVLKVFAPKDRIRFVAR